MTATAPKPATKPAAPAKGTQVLQIEKPDFRVIELRIEGTAPLVISRFSAKAMEQLRQSQEAGSVAKSKKVREPKNFDKLYEEAKHISTRGWEGFAASSIRNGSISACRACGLVMTRMKLALMVLADGYDVVDGTPLVRIEGEAEKYIAPVRNATGVIDLRVRPMYREWAATLRVRFDGGMLTASDVANLIARVGMQVGIGEGRPDSKDSAGVGFGLFQLS